MKTQLIPRDKIVFVSSRVEVSPAHVRRLRDARRSGLTLPLPIVVPRDDGTFECYSGDHRIKSLPGKVTDVKCYVRDPMPTRQVLLESVIANRDHGKPLTKEDRIASAHRLREAGCHDEEIAKALAMPVFRLERLLRQNPPMEISQTDRAVVRRAHPTGGANGHATTPRRREAPAVAPVTRRGAPILLTTLRQQLEAGALNPADEWTRTEARRVYDLLGVWFANGTGRAAG